MNPSDKPALVAMVTDALAYYGKPVSTFTLQVWVQACSPFSIEQVSKALTAHATDAERGQFAPKVADIVRILSGTATDRAALAWGKCLEAMGSVGPTPMWFLMTRQSMPLSRIWAAGRSCAERR